MHAGAQDVATLSARVRRVSCRTIACGIALLLALSACSDDKGACNAAVSDLCAKACECSSTCAVDFGDGWVETYGSSAEECAAMFATCNDSQSSFEPESCTAAINTGRCVSTSSGPAFLAPGCSFTAA